jgi:hypothetical protein
MLPVVAEVVGVGEPAQTTLERCGEIDGDLVFERCANEEAGQVEGGIAGRPVEQAHGGLPGVGVGHADAAPADLELVQV